MKNFNLDELTYQYLLGKVSTLPNTATGGTGGTYQYLLGKVSTVYEVLSELNKKSYQYLLGKVSTRTFLSRLAEALIVTCN